MSKRKREHDKRKKMNSPSKKSKAARKSYFASDEAKEAWEEKKERRDQLKLIDQREKIGIPRDCPLRPWQEPNPNCIACIICKLKCSFNK